MTRIQAAPLLSVDIDLQRFSTGVTPPTQAGFQSWHIVADADPFDGAYDPATDWNTNGGLPAVATGLSKTFGSITANLGGATYNGTVRADSRSGRDRGANAGAFPDLYRDFVFEQSASQPNAGFGRNYIKLVLSGLSPGQKYAFTGFHHDSIFTAEGATNSSASYQAWSDRTKLGGADGPSAWMDAHVGAGASYQPALGGANDPIPKYGRALSTGTDNADSYHYSLSFLTTADANGRVTVYTWADPNGSSGVQNASLLNGFQIGIPVPGDYNLDGVSDAADYTVWRDTLGSTTDLRANGDNAGASAGKIDQADYTFWRTHFGNHAGSGATESDMQAVVPEPCSLALLFVALILATAASRDRGGELVDGGRHALSLQQNSDVRPTPLRSRSRAARRWRARGCWWLEMSQSTQPPVRNCLKLLQKNRQWWKTY